MTYRSLLEEGTGRLRKAGVPDPAVDAWYLMEASFGINRTGYLAGMNEEAPADLLERWQEMLSLRERRIPLQHILGEQEFMGYSFLVNDQVLIPRPETELLAEKTIETAKQLLRDRASGPDRRNAEGRMEESRPGTLLRILDLCTGSGCIAISVDLALSEEFRGRGRVEITGSDLFEGALKTARENARRLGSEVIFMKSDLFEAIEGTFDIIVSNPPYIPTSLIETLQEEVRRYDPGTALDGGEDGLDFYRRIACDAPAHLAPDGVLLMEIGAGQARAICALLKEQNFVGICTEQDLNRLDRIVSGKRYNYENI